jgi:superfamily II DNA helicase RecQ
MVSNKRIIELREEIKSDYKNKSKWIYVKIQSVMEIVTKFYNELNQEQNKYEYESQMKMVLDFLSMHNIDESMISNYKKINHFANLVKHDHKDYQTYKFDFGLINDFLKSYNYLIDQLFNVNYLKNIVDKKSFYIYIEKIKDDNESKFDKNKTNNFKDDNELKYDKKINRIKFDKNRTNNFKYDNELKFDKKINRMKFDKNKTNNFKDYENYPSVRKFINVGIGNDDSGFNILGLKNLGYPAWKNICIYAVIYNFLQRSNNLDKPDFLIKYETTMGYIINFRKVYRYSMIILNMIRYNYFSENILNIKSVSKTQEELNLAIELINFYVKIITNMCDLTYSRLIINSNSSLSYTISAKESDAANIHCQSFTSFKNKISSDIWFEKSIIYNFKWTKENSNNLGIMLKDFFGYSTFKSGQFKALTDLLKSSENKIVMLPTAGGKSVIYYFVALLQPNPSIIISPTNTLIKDQIRNLKELHGITDVKGYFGGKTTLRYKDLWKKEFEISNKFIYVTPEVFQQSLVVKDLSEMNLDRKIANVFLDEVHSISHWSHGFRPDYLMLSHNLVKYLDHTRYIGLTATANYRVLNNILLQLKMKEKNIICPIDLRRRNIDYSFETYSDYHELKKKFDKVLESISQRDESDYKTLIFASSNLINRSYIDSLKIESKYDIDLFLEEDIFSYEGFVKGRKSILINEDEIGVGINIPTVKRVIHLDFPLSKSQYVQQIGRVERGNSQGEVTAYYKPKKYMSYSEKKIVSCDTNINQVMSLLETLNNDSPVKRVFNKMIGHLDSYDKMSTYVYNQYKKIDQSKSFYIDITFDNSEGSEEVKHKTCIYFLYILGVITDWYINHKGNRWTIYRVKKKIKPNLNDYKSNTIKYITSLEEDKKIIYEIERASSVKSLIYTLLKWYYYNFISFHREQLLNVIDFFEMYTIDSNKSDIQEVLARYFRSPLINSKIQKDEIIDTYSIKEIIDLIDKEDRNNELLSNIEKKIENKYNYKYDFFIYYFHFRNSNYINFSRLNRLIKIINKLKNENMSNYIHYLYPKNSSFDMRNIFIEVFKEYLSTDEVYLRIFSNVNKDKNYYLHLLKSINDDLEVMYEDDVSERRR